jgi:FixJ family two-component response regulator
MAHVDSPASQIKDILDLRKSIRLDSIILYSDKPDLRDVVHAMKFGAFDFLKTPLGEDELKSCLTMAAEQNSLNLTILQEKALILSNLTRLTIRENSVLELIIKGNSNKVIAYNLHISQRTVENHRAHIMQKMSAKSIAQLMIMLNSVSA